MTYTIETTHNISRLAWDGEKWVGKHREYLQISEFSQAVAIANTVKIAYPQKKIEVINKNGLIEKFL